MGYTHYFGIKKGRVKSEKLELLYQRAIKDCYKVIKYWQNMHAKGSDTDHYRLSGYSAHSNKYGGLDINGKQELAHENFYMREHFKENENNFCKTNRKPYDTVVVACLLILKHRLKDNFIFESDGNSIELAEGLELAQKVTKLKIKIPQSIKHVLKEVS